ncbi:MAG: hypothetical protein IJA90_00685 [Peptococcaceae bacterium]|nr:hypothetical protein [Peptococcaceae bacterium]
MKRQKHISLLLAFSLLFLLSSCRDEPAPLVIDHEQMTASDTGQKIAQTSGYVPMMPLN